MHYAPLARSWHPPHRVLRIGEGHACRHRRPRPPDHDPQGRRRCPERGGPPTPVDPDNWYVHTLITRLSGTTPRQLEAVSAGSLLYAALRFVEGLGLIWRQRWAAYVTVIGTAAFIPLEVVELTRRVSWPKLVVIAMNGAVVWYLVARLRIGGTSRPD